VYRVMMLAADDHRGSDQVHRQTAFDARQQASREHQRQRRSVSLSYIVYGVGELGRRMAR